MRRRAYGIWIASAWLCVSCGDAAGGSAEHATKTAISSKGANAAAAALGPGLSAEFLADAGDGWVSLAEGHWKIPANSEHYFCVRQNVTRDVAVHAFRPITPLGTHHDTLGVWATALAKEGVTECSPNSIADRMLVGAGPGAHDYELPDGVALELHAGEQLAINLHLFNTSDQELEGTSGFLGRIIAEDEVEHHAESVLGGPYVLEIPPGSGIEQSGQCTMANDATIFAVAPHMHQKGVHMKIVAESSLDGSVVLHDEDYSFDAQVLHTVEPVRMQRDDAVKVFCTYDNDTDHTLHFGNSTLDEMCMAQIMRYPESDTPAQMCPR